MTFDYEAAVKAEREACARLVEADGLARGEHGYMLIKAATRIRARGEFSKPLDNAVHASDISAERVDETPKCKDDPRAPHGFDRNASHNADRYVCECEFWEPPEEKNN